MPITVNIGRRVHYWPTKDDLKTMTQYDAKTPFTASVRFLHADGLMGLEVVDQAGVLHRISGVKSFEQPGKGKLKATIAHGKAEVRPHVDDGLIKHRPKHLKGSSVRHA